MAIAFDAQSSAFPSGNPNTTCQTTHVVGSGENRMLIAATFTDSATVSVTYGGVAMTQIRQYQMSGTRWLTMFGLVSPTPGPATIKATIVGGTLVQMGSVSYTGVKQTITPDSQADGTVASDTTITGTTTTVANNCWTVMFARMPSNNISAGTGTTMRISDTFKALFDSNGAITPAGSSSLIANTSGAAGQCAQIIISLEPAELIGLDSASSSGYITASSSASWSHVVAGTNRFLVVGVSMLSVAGTTVTGITYNGVALTKIGDVASAAGAVRVELWGLVAPATGNNNIVVTTSAATDFVANAESFTGVNQSTPTEAYNEATATNVGAADATVDVTTTKHNAIVIDQVGTDDTAITVGAGQTQQQNQTGTLGTGAMSTESKAYPGVVTMSWANVADLATWAIASVAVLPVTTFSPSLSPSASASVSASISPSSSRSPSASSSLSLSPSASLSPSTSLSPSSSSSSSDSPSASLSPSASHSPSASASSSFSASASPSAQIPLMMMGIGS